MYVTREAAEAAGSTAEAGPSAAGASAEAEDPLATQELEEGEELENLDLTEHGHRRGRERRQPALSRRPLAPHDDQSDPHENADESRECCAA